MKQRISYLPPEARLISRIASLMRRFIGFSIYIFCSACLVALIPVLYLFVGFSTKRLGFTLRLIISAFFRLVIVYVRYLKVIDVSIVTHSGQDLAPILVANHISMFDIISVIAFFPNCITFVNTRYWKLPIITPIAMGCGFIPIKIDEAQSRLKAFLRARLWLSSGGKLVVFPEGTRTKDGSLNSFHSGIFRLAIECQLPITPLVFTAERPIFSKVKDCALSTDMVRYHIHLMPQIIPPKALAERHIVKAFTLKVQQIFGRWLEKEWVPKWQRQQKDGL